MDDPQVISLFPTPMYTCKLEGTEYDSVQGDLQRVVNKLYANDSWGQNTFWSSNTHFLSNKGDFSESILKLENMNIVTDAIMRHCKNFMAMMQVKPGYKPIIDTSWLTLTKPGLHAHTHDHGTNAISGVYWYKTNGKDGDIVFRNALKALKCNPIGGIECHEINFSPEQGRLVMWPSFLDHSVKENQTIEDRISLSFNILLETGSG